jgi:hypothetical protein
MKTNNLSHLYLYIFSSVSFAMADFAMTNKEQNNRYNSSQRLILLEVISKTGI